MVMQTDELMPALYLSEGLQFRDDHPIPSPEPNEALILVLLAGICNTDLELAQGYLNFKGIPGHEFVGLVKRSDGNENLVGRRVVGEININCNSCKNCDVAMPTHCPNRTTLGIRGKDGAFAKYLTLPVNNLHPLPPSISNEEAVFVEPLASACEITQKIHICPTNKVVVLGDGKLGLLCAQVLQLTGCHLTVVGHHEDSLAMMEKRGIETSTCPKIRGADVVVEATGKPSGLNAACQMVRPRGTIVLKSTYHNTVNIDLSQLVVNEINLVGSRCGPFPPAIRLLERKLVDVKSLIHDRYPLSSGANAFQKANEKGVLKILIEP